MPERVPEAPHPTHPVWHLLLRLMVRARSRPPGSLAGLQDCAGLPRFDARSDVVVLHCAAWRAPIGPIPRRCGGGECPGCNCADGDMMLWRKKVRAHRKISMLCQGIARPCVPPRVVLAGCTEDAGACAKGGEDVFTGLVSAPNNDPNSSWGRIGQPLT